MAAGIVAHVHQHGFPVTVALGDSIVCVKCQGTGMLPGSVVCKECHGFGKLMSIDDERNWVQEYIASEDDEGPDA